MTVARLKDQEQRIKSGYSFSFQNCAPICFVRGNFNAVAAVRQINLLINRKQKGFQCEPLQLFFFSLSDSKIILFGFWKLGCTKLAARTHSDLQILKGRFAYKTSLVSGILLFVWCKKTK